LDVFTLIAFAKAQVRRAAKAWLHTYARIENLWPTSRSVTATRKAIFSRRCGVGNVCLSYTP